MLWPFLDGCNRNIANGKLQSKLSWIVTHVLGDTPPSVPQSGEPLVFTLRSRKLKPKWERERVRGITKRRMRRARSDSGSEGDE